MPGICLNPNPYCELSIGYLWRWVTWIGRLDLFILAFMLAYAVAVSIRVSYRFHLTRRIQGIDTASCNRKRLLADLSSKARNLKSIAFVAPYLGLAGTCVGLLNLFRGVGMESHAVMEMMAAEAVAAPLTTAAGILVAIPAICFHNYLCTRIDQLQSEMSDEELAPTSAFRKAQTLPLRKRFSEFPAFALIAAPVLALLGGAFMPLFSFHYPTGLDIELAPARCEYDGNDRLIVLHITDAGKIFLNLEQEDQNSLAARLAEIYDTRVHRNLYLLADDGTPFQTVADAIDIVKNAPVTPNLDSRNITVKLITPRAMNAPCREPIVAPSSQHTLR